EDQITIRVSNRGGTRSRPSLSSPPHDLTGLQFDTNRKTVVVSAARINVTVHEDHPSVMVLERPPVETINLLHYGLAAATSGGQASESAIRRGDGAEHQGASGGRRGKRRRTGGVWSAHAPTITTGRRYADGTVARLMCV